MPVVQDLIDEVHALSSTLTERVDAADKEQKRRGEELTSKTALMAAEYKGQTDALNARINALMEQVEQARIEAARPPLHGSGTNGRKEWSPMHKAFRKAMRAKGDIHALSMEEKQLVCKEYMPQEQKALYAADATTGGFFASTDFMDELQAYRLLISKMRGICRIQATSGERVDMPNLANDCTVYWAAEQSSFTDSADPTTGMLQIPVHEMRGLLKISQQNLEDSMFNLETFIKDRLVKNFAKKEGAGFINGTGTGQPRGIMSYPSKATTSYGGGSAGKSNVTDAIPFVLSGAAVGKIIQEDVTNVLMDLKADYDNMESTAYILTRGTLNTIRLFKDSQNRPLWIPFGGDIPAMINNRKYVEMPDMPEIASGNLPILVGDFSNYMIVDRITLNIQQLNELFAVSGLVGFIARMRVGGDVLLPESFRSLKIN